MNYPNFNQNFNIINPYFSYHPSQFCFNSNDQIYNLPRNNFTEPTNIQQIRTPIVNHFPEIPIPKNIVCTANLGCKLDLKLIAGKARNSEYNPKRFSAVIMRIKEPKTTSLIFSSGKLVCTGAKSETAAKLAARKFSRIIQKLGFEVSFNNFKIQNIVGSCDVRFSICLEALQLSHGEFVTYEAETFPGLIYKLVVRKLEDNKLEDNKLEDNKLVDKKLVDYKMVILIFKSGKIILTGGKCEEQLNEAFTKIYPILKKFTYKKPITQ